MFQMREMSSIVLPGVRLSPSDNVHIPGQGTYTQHGYIYSSLVGELSTTTNPDKTVLSNKNLQLSWKNIFVDHSRGLRLGWRLPRAWSSGRSYSQDNLCQSQVRVEAVNPRDYCVF